MLLILFQIFQDDGEFSPRQTSARWKLQHKRQVLNQKIFRQTKLRDGAENLMKALRLVIYVRLYEQLS